MSVFLRRLRAGETPTEQDWNELAELVERLCSVGGSGTVELSLGPSGLQVTDNRAARLFARITGAPTGARYPYVAVDVRADGTVADRAADAARPEGTASYVPAVEVNGRTDVAEDTIVELVPVEDDEELAYGFAAPGDGGGPPGHGMYTVLITGGTGPCYDCTEYDAADPLTCPPTMDDVAGVPAGKFYAYPPTFCKVGRFYDARKKGVIPEGEVGEGLTLYLGRGETLVDLSCPEDGADGVVTYPD